MRPIKFRAWDETLQKMHDEIYFKDFQGETIVHEQGLNEGIEICGQVYDLMQFTGLYDKNGKEIYEGDVVQELFADAVWKHVIRWSIENSGFWLGTARHLNRGTATDLEVISNIYEPPLEN